MSREDDCEPRSCTCTRLAAMADGWLMMILLRSCGAIAQLGRPDGGTLRVRSEPLLVHEILNAWIPQCAAAQCNQAWMHSGPQVLPRWWSHALEPPQRNIRKTPCRHRQVRVTPASRGKRGPAPGHGWRVFSREHGAGHREGISRSRQRTTRAPGPPALRPQLGRYMLWRAGLMARHTAMGRQPSTTRLLTTSAPPAACLVPATCAHMPGAVSVAKTPYCDPHTGPRLRTPTTQRCTPAEENAANQGYLC